MIKEHSHIIQSQSIEINFENIGEAMGVQNRIAEVFYERLLPQMEILFDDLAGKDHIITTEKLEIDCGILSQKNWEQEWVENTLRNLKAELLTLDKKKIDSLHVADSFFFFLQHARLPWNSNIRSTGIFEQEIVTDHSFLEKLKKILQQSDMEIKRLLQQFSFAFLKKVADAILEQAIASNKHIPYPAEYFSQTDKQQIQEKIIYIFADKKYTPGKNKLVQKENQLAGIQTNKHLKRIAGEKKPLDHSPEEIYINNAGLVILHPFLPKLFELLHLAKENKWINKDAQETAILVTQFLVTGADEFPEFDLALNKILCDIPLNDTLKTEISITKETRLVCEELLKEVIGHWRILKNTGTQALRETFLQRHGKLTKVDNGWLLQVEQKAVDVLLGSLPWGIGIIKLPWMENLLHTEW